MASVRKVSRTTWDLDVAPGNLEGAAAAWEDLARNLYETLGARIDACRSITDDWEGKDADSWREHNDRYRRDLEAVVEECHTVSGHAYTAAAVMRIYHGHLRSALTELLSFVPHDSDSSHITFELGEPAHEHRLSAGLVEAEQIREQFTTELLRVNVDLTASVIAFENLIRSLAPMANGSTPLFDTPAEAGDSGFVDVDGRRVFNAGSGDNEIWAYRYPKPDGPLQVSMDGKTYSVPPGTEVTIRTGAGADKITVPSGTDVGVTILAGEGDDTVEVGGGDDRVYGGAGDDNILSRGGDDRVSGGAGHDYIETHGGDDVITGGSGTDDLYGLGDSNTILGGRGDDYIEGGSGNSSIHGGLGEDIISGGRGDDTIIGGGGADAVYAGAGKDHVVDTGHDSVYAEEDDAVDTGGQIVVEVTEPPAWIEISGSDEFIERVRADLDMYSASPVGQEMVEALDADVGGTGGSGNTLTITETQDEWANETTTAPQPDGNLETTVTYNRSDTPYGSPPSVVLHHELAHVHADWNGHSSSTTLDDRYGVDEGVKESEYQTTGLPYDHDHDPSTPDRNHPEHGINLTENAMRSEMGLRERETYNPPEP